MEKTALIVEVPESEFLVGNLRTEFDETASKGVPAHITVLYPFIPFSELTNTVVSTLQTLALETKKFPFELTKWNRFDSALWLHPVPEAPFAELTRRVFACFPGYPPYGGIYSNLQPHLTVAQFDSSEREDARWQHIEESTKQSLPISCCAGELAVYVNRASGVWEKYLTLPFDDGS